MRASYLTAAVMTLMGLSMATPAWASDHQRVDLSSSSATVRNLNADWEDLDTETLAAHWGWRRGFYGGGFYGARFYGGGFYGGGFYGARFYGGYWGPRFYGGYFGPRFIYGGFGYPVYSYSTFGFFPCADQVITPVQTVPLAPQVIQPAPTPANPGSTLPAPTPVPGKQVPGTFDYDGGPARPVPPPAVEERNISIPRGPSVYSEIVVSIPTPVQKPAAKWAFPAYGEAPTRR